MEKEELFQKRMSELSKKAFFRGILTFSDFLDLNQQNILHSLCRSLEDNGVRIRLFGGYETAERQMAAFVPDAFCCEEEFDYQEDYPISCIKISPLNKKFSDVLTHRDYLGSILNLGLDRSKIGDILLKQDCAYVFCHSSVCEYLIGEINRIKHTSVQAQRVLEETELPAPEREEVSGTVASPRLDSVIALAFQTSRSSMIPFIEGGKVFVNGKSVVSNGYVLKDGDIISVRGKGKFQFGSVTCKTKKNRYHVVLYRYC